MASESRRRTVLMLLPPPTARADPPPGDSAALRHGGPCSLSSRLRCLSREEATDGEPDQDRRVVHQPRQRPQRAGPDASTRQNQLILRFSDHPDASITLAGQEADNLRTWLNSVANDLSHLHLDTPRPDPACAIARPPAGRPGQLAAAAGPGRPQWGKDRGPRRRGRAARARGAGNPRHSSSRSPGACHRTSSTGSVTCQPSPRIGTASPGRCSSGRAVPLPGGPDLHPVQERVDADQRGMTRRGGANTGDPDRSWFNLRAGTASGRRVMGVEGRKARGPGWYRPDRARSRGLLGKICPIKAPRWESNVRNGFCNGVQTLAGLSNRPRRDESFGGESRRPVTSRSGIGTPSSPHLEGG